MQLIITDEDPCWGEVLQLVGSGITRGNLSPVTATPDLPTALEAAEALAASRPLVAVPPPPPLEIAGLTPVVAGNPPGSPTKLDATGMPWDHRIHSEVKKLNANGTWRLRRNLDPAVHEQVKAEYAAAGRVAASLPGVVAAGAAAIASTVIGSVVGAAPVPPPPAPSGLFGDTPAATAPVPPPPPPAAEPAPMTFSEACMKITAAITAKQITKEDVPLALGRMGLPNLAVVASQPVVIPTLLKELGL